MAGRRAQGGGGGIRERLWTRFLRIDRTVIRRAVGRFSITTEDGRQLATRVGETFMAGYNTMLHLGDPTAVASLGLEIDAHFRPFFFEGAATGYLPRGYISPTHRLERVERDLLRMHPGYRYLYYVGLGFWYGFRHPWNPRSLDGLAPHVDPMYLPLCHDGYGFKVGFFDVPRRPAARRLLERGNPAHRGAMYQGFGRSLFFACMDDPDRYARERDAGDGARRNDIEIGRSLALAFSGTDRPGIIGEHLAGAIADDGDEDLGARLLGVTWALTAREMNDADHFRACMEGAGTWRNLLSRLPVLCLEVLERSKSYSQWQDDTRRAALEAYRSAGVSAGLGTAP